jgi:hypothetical protein
MRFDIQSKSALSSSFMPVSSGLLQRKCACGGTLGPTGECEECRRKREHASAVADQLLGTRSASSGPRSGQDFSGVPLHPKGQRPSSAPARNGAASAAQRNSFFGDGRFPATTLAGDVERGPGSGFHAPLPIPSNTVHCVKKWNPCSAPYSPGSWAAKVSYHCPRLFMGIILPGTTQESYVTIPDEFIGVDSAGRDMYECRPGFKVRLWTDIGDVAATATNRSLLYPDQQSCHNGYRTILKGVLEGLFVPRGGGRPAGIRVNAPPPPGGFPCP